MLIQAHKITKNYGGFPILEEVSCQINSQAKIGLIGSNGSGKSTLLKILTGIEKADEGVVSYRKDLKVSYIQQQIDYPEKSLLNYLLDSFAEIKLLKEQLTLCEQQMMSPDLSNDELTKILNRYSKIQEGFEEAGGYVIEERVLSTLKGLGIANLSENNITSLSGGEKMRAELCKTLLSNADVYLLDEPTNHLDQAGIEWLAEYLKGAKNAVVVISHDRYFLNEVAKQIIEVEDGNIYEYSGNYDTYKILKEKAQAKREKDFDLQQQEIQRIKLAIRRFRQWANEGDNEKFYKKAKQLEHRLEKMEVLKNPVKNENRLNQKVAQAGKSGKEVVKVENLSMNFQENFLFEAQDFMLYRSERIILQGANGSGKSTFIKLLLGELTPTGGSVEMGASVKVGYLPQELSFKKKEERVLNFAKEFAPNEQAARQILAKFGFYASDVSKRLKDLSGGEKVRLYLAKIFQTPINLLILDEPTNHLDISGREEIEEIIENYQGTLLVISHDRYFIEKYFSTTLTIENHLMVKK